MRTLAILTLLVVTTTAHAAYRFAFGGCNFQRLGQSHWNTIAAEKPKLWIWNGDMIYADGTTIPVRRQEYDHLKNNKFYAAFRTAISIVGVWDDHDFNKDNASGNFKDKAESQRAALDFLDEPAGSSRRRQEGIYTSYQIAPSEGRVRLILLDGRYFRDEPGAESDMLGETQWQWLQSQLEDSNQAKDEAIFIVSGSQVLAEGTGADRWEQYPKSQKRLFDLLTKTEAPVVFLTGDRHHAEFSRKEVGGKAYYDATSSGLTHGSFGSAPNPNRVGPVYQGRNFALVDLERKEGKLSATVELRKIGGDPIHRITVF